LLYILCIGKGIVIPYSTKISYIDGKKKCVKRQCDSHWSDVWNFVFQHALTNWW